MWLSLLTRKFRKLENTNAHDTMYGIYLKNFSTKEFWGEIIQQRLIDSREVTQFE